jgi:hypothetical protein
MRSFVQTFDPLSPFEVPWLLNQFRKPINRNQGGFDAVGPFKVWGKMVVRFIQVARPYVMKMIFFAALAAKVGAECPTKDMGVEIY